MVHLLSVLGRLVRTRDNGYAFIGFIYTNTSMRRDVYLMKMGLSMGN